MVYKSTTANKSITTTGKLTENTIRSIEQDHRKFHPNHRSSWRNLKMPVPNLKDILNRKRNLNTRTKSTSNHLYARQPSVFSLHSFLYFQVPVHTYFLSRRTRDACCRPSGTQWSRRIHDSVRSRIITPCGVFWWPEVHFWDWRTRYREEDKLQHHNNNRQTSDLQPTSTQ